MKPLLDKTVSKKSNDIVRLYRPPTSNEMATEGKYLSLPNDCSSEIMRHLGHYFLHLLILVNKSFHNLLTRLLENEPIIFAYWNNRRINSVLLERLYEKDKAFLNEHKPTCHRGDIPLCSMIICSTKWPDIDPRRLHLVSLVNPHTGGPALQSFWCGDITGFDHILFNNYLLHNDQLFHNYLLHNDILFKHIDLSSYGVLNWRKSASEDEPPDASSYGFPSFFNFSLEEHGYLEIMIAQLEREAICINVLPEFVCSTNTLENTLGIPVVESSVTLTIGDCKNLNRL
jgi:hypothetical protein